MTNTEQDISQCGIFGHDYANGNCDACGAPEPRTPSRGGAYTHTHDCDTHALGVAVRIVLDTDLPFTVENLQGAVFGYRDAFPHRICFGRCAQLRLGAVESELKLLRRQQRHTWNADTEMAINTLVMERTAITQEVDA